MSDRKAFADLGPISPDLFNPMRGKILVRREEAPSNYGRIELIKEDNNDRRFKPTVGRIVKLGEEARTPEENAKIGWSVSVGERVLINRFAGHDVIIDGDDFYNIMEESDILGVLTPEATVFA